MPCVDVEAKPVAEVDRIAPPAIPIVRNDEGPAEKEQHNNVLRLFFNRLVSNVNKLATAIDRINISITELGDRITALELSITNILALVRPGVIESTATLYITEDSDENNIVRITNASAISVVLHLAAPIGVIIHFHQGGAGQITVSAAVGATVTSSRSLVTAAQYAALSVFKLSATEWTLVGDQE